MDMEDRCHMEFSPCLSFAVALSASYTFTHTDLHAHTYCQMGWGSDYTHEHTNICSW